MEFYVYILKDENIPFYVGKGKNKRMYEHYRLSKQTNRKSPVLDKIRKMTKLGKKINYEIVFKTNDSICAYEYEKNLIKKLGRRNIDNGPLLNLTDGGEGVINYKYTDEHRKNLSKSIKLAIKEGRYKPSGGRKSGTTINDIHKEKISKTLINYWKSDKGIKMKENLSIIGKSLTINGKRILSDEARKKMSEGGKKHKKQTPS